MTDEVIILVHHGQQLVKKPCTLVEKQVNSLKSTNLSAQRREFFKNKWDKVPFFLKIQERQIYCKLFDTIGGFYSHVMWINYQHFVALFSGLVTIMWRIWNRWTFSTYQIFAFCTHQNRYFHLFYSLLISIYMLKFFFLYLKTTF